MKPGTESAFFPAAFGLVAGSKRGGHSETDWIETHADIDGLVALARTALDRPHSDARWIAWGLAEWYWRQRRLDDVLELADAADRLGVLAATLPMASQAALNTGDPRRAIAMLRRDPQSLKKDSWRMEILVLASAAVGDRATGDVARDLVELASDDRIEWAMAWIEQNAATGRPGLVADALGSYLQWRSGDADAWLRYAVARRDAPLEGGFSALERSEQVRAATRIAMALGAGTETATRASRLLVSQETAAQ